MRCFIPWLFLCSIKITKFWGDRTNVWAQTLNTGAVVNHSSTIRCWFMYTVTEMRPGGLKNKDLSWKYAYSWRQGQGSSGAFLLLRVFLTHVQFSCGLPPAISTQVNPFFAGSPQPPLEKLRATVAAAAWLAQHKMVHVLHKTQCMQR